MHIINQKPLDTAPLLCSDCGQLKRQFYVLGIKSLICVDCATGIARDFHADFDLIFNSDPQPVHAVKYGTRPCLSAASSVPSAASMHWFTTIDAPTLSHRRTLSLSRSH